MVVLGAMARTIVPDNMSSVTKTADALNTSVVASFLDYAQAPGLFPRCFRQDAATEHEQHRAADQARVADGPVVPGGAAQRHSSSSPPAASSLDVVAAPGSSTTAGTAIASRCAGDFARGAHP